MSVEDVTLMAAPFEYGLPLQRSPSGESTMSMHSMLYKSDTSDQLVFGVLDVGNLINLAELGSDMPQPDVALRFQAAKARTWGESALLASDDDEEGPTADMLATYPPTNARFSAEQLSSTTGATPSAAMPIASSSPSEDRFLEYFGSPGSSTHDSPRSTAESFGSSRCTDGFTIASHTPHTSSDILSTTPEASSSANTSAYANATPGARLPSDHTNFARPASVGPVKLHRRQKSARRVPPPPFSAEFLRAVRQKMIESTTSGRTLSPPATRLQHHSPTSSASSNASNASTQSDFSCLSGRSFADTPPLPAEVWVCVFGFLPAIWLLDLQAVCHSWRQTCWDTVNMLDLVGRLEAQVAPNAWIAVLPRLTNLKHLTLPAHLPTDEALTLLTGHHGLESLAIHCHDTATTFTGLLQIATMPKLLRLSLWLPRHIHASALRPLIPLLDRLTHFKLETLRQSFCERALQSLDLMVNLRLLDLSWCKRLTPSTFSRIAKLPHLETLILDMCGCDITMSGIAHLKVLTQLSDLSLKWCDQLSDAMLPTLASFRALTKLDVSFCRHITSAAIALWLPHVTVSLTIPHLIHER